MKYILLLALPPPPPHTHILNKLLFTVCVAILCSNKLFFWHQSKFGFGSCMKRQPMRRVQKAPSTFAWGDAKTEIMGSVLWAQTGFQRILVKDKLKMTVGTSARREGNESDWLSVLHHWFDGDWWEGMEDGLGVGCGTKGGKGRQLMHFTYNKQYKSKT